MSFVSSRGLWKETAHVRHNSYALSAAMCGAKNRVPSAECWGQLGG